MFVCLFVIACLVMSVLISDVIDQCSLKISVCLLVKSRL